MKNIYPGVWLFLACIAILVFAPPLYAEVFQYFDDEGTLIVTDNPFGLKRPRAAQPLKTYKPKQDQQVALRLLDDVQYDYYPVFGRSFGEVINSIQANGPYDTGDNRRYAGQTRWATGWSYAFGSTYTKERDVYRAVVTVSDIQYRSDIVVLLPMLSPDAELGHHDLQQWQGFMTKLVEHEHDHVKIVREPLPREEAIKKVLALRELLVPAEPGVAPDSLIQQAVENATARIGHEMLRTVKAKNDEYDRLTEHGLKPEMKAVFFSAGY